MRWWLGTKAANNPLSIGFTNTEKAEAPTVSTYWGFMPVCLAQCLNSVLNVKALVKEQGNGFNSCLLHHCEIFAKVRFHRSYTLAKSMSVQCGPAICQYNVYILAYHEYGEPETEA